MGEIFFGLGNPGKRYAPTRHNAGWQVLDRLAERFGTAFRRSNLVHGEIADLDAEGRRLRLVKPSSFMNLVGPVYRRCLEVFGQEAGGVLVVVDDFALPFGRLRLRARGSAGTHRGLQSIEEALGSQEYPRLRLGVGPAPEGTDWAGYVLKRYDARQRRELPDLLDRAADAALSWARDGFEAAANRFNPAPENGL